MNRLDPVSHAVLLLKERRRDGEEAGSTQIARAVIGLKQNQFACLLAPKDQLKVREDVTAHPESLCFSVCVKANGSGCGDIRASGVRRSARPLTSLPGIQPLPRGKQSRRAVRVIRCRGVSSCLAGAPLRCVRDASARFLCHPLPTQH